MFYSYSLCIQNYEEDLVRFPNLLLPDGLGDQCSKKVGMNLFSFFNVSNSRRLGVCDIYITNSACLIALGDTLSDLIQCSNFANKWFNSIFDSIKNSIQTIIQLMEKHDDSIQKLIQFNSQGIIDTSRLEKLPQKSYSITFFPENSIQKLIQKF